MSRLMRIRKGRDFESVYQEGAVIRGPLFVVRMKRGDEGPTRWAFAVGKRLDKRSAARNRLRRRLREAAARQVDAPAGALILTARGPAMDVSVEALTRELTRMLARVVTPAGSAAS
jgi:ribonuclease P protein component